MGGNILQLGQDFDTLLFFPFSPGSIFFSFLISLLPYCFTSRIFKHYTCRSIKFQFLKINICSFQCNLPFKILCNIAPICRLNQGLSFVIKLISSYTTDQSDLLISDRLYIDYPFCSMCCMLSHMRTHGCACVSNLSSVVDPHRADQADVHYSLGGQVSSGSRNLPGGR